MIEQLLNSKGHADVERIVEEFCTDVLQIENLQSLGRPEPIERALQYIHENYCHNISLEEVAGICRVSPEHFSRTFSGETGFSFCRYINELRMKKAEAALRRGDNVSIAELAADCGFNDSNYFSLKFKKMYGISPKKFQLENKK